MGITLDAQGLPGRDARRPRERRLAARDGDRVRDDRLRRLPAAADRDQEDRLPGRPGRAGQSPPKASASRRRASSRTAWPPRRPDPRAEHPGRHRHARGDRLPGGRQDRHDRRLHRRLVRRLHARATTAVWVGYPKDDIPMSSLYYGAPVDGGTFPAEIWGDYMSRSRATSAATSRRRSMPSTPQPFFGTLRASRARGAPTTTSRRPAPRRRRRRSRHRRHRRPTTRARRRTTATEGFDPGAYESPPQPEPETVAPPPADADGGATAPPG